MSDKKPIHHAINYIEFAVADIEAAKRFYADAFEWRFNEYGPTYAGIREGDGEVGGLRVVTDAPIVAPLAILYSSDLEASLKAVMDAGGKITTQPFSFPGGRRFHFQDPSGNELAVWSDS